MKTRKILPGVVAISIALTFASCSKKEESANNQPSNQNATEEMMRENGQNPDDAIFDNEAERNNRKGFVYTVGNETGTNNIHIYKQHADGHLSHEGMEASGGAGNGMGLGSQGAVILDKHHDYLYAVNAGDNSISSFHVHHNGSLTLAHTRNSGGTTPVSLTLHHNHLYVVHSGNSRIKGFMTGPGGTMTPIAGSNKALSANPAGPAQISFSPNGDYLYVTEKMTNKISKFSVNAMGVAGMRTSMTSVGNTPFGFSFARDHYMVVSNAEMGAPHASSATSYAGINSGNLNDVNGDVGNNQTAACWVATTHHGRYAFTTNTGSDNISSYYVSPWGALYLIHSNIPSGDAPIDMTIASNNYYVYALCAIDHTIQEYSRTWFGGLNHTGQISGVTPHAVGLASW